MHKNTALLRGGFSVLYIMQFKAGITRVKRILFVLLLSALMFSVAIIYSRDEYERQWLSINVGNKCTEVLIIRKRGRGQQASLLLLGSSRDLVRMGRDARVIADSGYQVIALLSEQKISSSTADILLNIASRISYMSVCDGKYLLILDGYDLADLSILAPIEAPIQPCACVMLGSSMRSDSIDNTVYARALNRLSCQVIIIESSGAPVNSDTLKIDRYYNNRRVGVVNMKDVGCDLDVARGVVIRSICEALHAKLHALGAMAD